MMTECKKELLSLLLKAWEEEPELDLMRIIEHVAASAGHLGSISNLKDDVLLYQLEQKSCGCSPRLGGVHSEFIPDFRSALMSARGCKV